MKWMRMIVIVLAGSCLTLGSLSCASRQERPVAMGVRATQGVWIFQHKLQLDIPDRKLSQSFTGMMRLDSANKTAHVAGVAGLGMQLFAVRVTPDEVRVEYLHPMLRKIPNVSGYIASCIRGVWFDYLPQIWSAQPVWLTDTLGDATVSSSGDSVGGIWPEHLFYVNERIPFTLSVRLLQAQQETP